VAEPSARAAVIQLAAAIVILALFIAAAIVSLAAATDSTLSNRLPLQIAIVITGGFVAVLAAMSVLAIGLARGGLRLPRPGEMFGLVTLSLLSFLLPAAAVSVSVVTIGTVNATLLTKAQVQIPIVLIASVLALLGGLSFIVIVLSHLKLTTPRYALGMPEGSIRAVLAISLLFLFMILSVFLYGTLSQADATDAAKSSAIDIAKQLVTTVATLAVSVAGFYFGAASVTAAARAVGRVEPKLNLLSPTGQQTLPRDGSAELADIRLGSEPPGQALSWKVIGDNDGKLFQSAPNVFTYRRGTAASDLVTLEFSLQSNPDITTKLEVKVP